MNKIKKIIPFSFLFLISCYSLVSLFFSNEFEVIKIAPLSTSLFQAFVSSVLVFILGALGGFCLFTVGRSYRRAFLFLILLPQFLPSSLFMSSLLTFFDILSIEFKGLSAVIFTHVVLNTGLASCIFYFLFQKKIFSLVDVLNIYGFSKKEFILSVLKSGLVSQVISVFTFFILVHSLSFSIPLILTNEVVSIEHLLYDSLNRGSGLFIGVLTVIFYFLMGRIDINSKSASTAFLSSSRELSSMSLAKIFLFIYSFPALLCLTFLLKISLDSNYSDIDLSLMLQAFKGQLLILSVGSIFFFITLVSGLITNLHKSRVYYLFIPSVSLLLFSGFLLSSILPEVFVIGIGSYLSLFIFINIFLSSSFSNFHDASEVFQIYNVKDKLSFFLKTEKKNVLLSFSLMSIWMGGDYVFSGGLSKELISFGSLSKKALMSYQIQESQVFSFMSFMTSLFFILLFVLVVYGKNIRISSK